MAYKFAGHWGTQPFLAVTTGRPLAGTNFTVYESNGTSLANLYTTRTKSVAATNPRMTDSYGNGEFYADPGDYFILCNGITIPVTVDADPVETYFGARRTVDNSLANVPVAENITRWSSDAILTAAATGTLYLTAIDVPPRTLVSSATFISATTAAVTPTNWWFVLATGDAAAPIVLAVTANQLTTAWATNTVKTVPFAAAYTTGNISATYYLGLAMTATTVPTMRGANLSNAIMSSAFVPTLAGTSTTGLTVPVAVGAILTLVTAGANVPYGALT